MQGPLEIIRSLNLPAPTGVLQVGTSIGQELGYFASGGISHGAFIEPLDGPFSILSQRCAGIPTFLPIQALCGSRDGETVEFHVATNNGESSSIFAPKSHLVHYPHIHFPETISLPTFTLDRIFATLAQHRPDVARQIDLLYMDVQGAELDVLKGAELTLRRIRYIHTEVGLGDGYDGAAPVEEVILMLRDHGFRIHELEIGDSGWGNAMFIRHAEA